MVDEEFSAQGSSPDSGSASPGGLSGARTAVAAEAQLLLVDEAILRSVSLGSSFQGAGWIWRLQPDKMAENELEALWSLGKPGSRYDMFLSHTWHTPGRLKFRSLLLAFNWHYALLGCFLGVFMALLLYAIDALPMPMILRCT